MPWLACVHVPSQGPSSSSAGHSCHVWGSYAHLRASRIISWEGRREEDTTTTERPQTGHHCCCRFVCGARPSCRVEPCSKQRNNSPSESTIDRCTEESVGKYGRRGQGGGIPAKLFEGIVRRFLKEAASTQQPQGSIQNIGVPSSSGRQTAPNLQTAKGEPSMEATCARRPSAGSTPAAHAHTFIRTFQLAHLDMRSITQKLRTHQRPGSRFPGGTDMLSLSII